MMRLEWAEEAERDDLPRLYNFLAHRNPGAAARAIQALVDAPELLLDQPGIGSPLRGYSPRDVRRWVVEKYEIRYEVTKDVLTVLRVWHTREDR